MLSGKPRELQAGEEVPALPIANNSFPCLVTGGAELEVLPHFVSEEYYQVNARNALRQLTYGTPLFKGRFFSKDNLKLAWRNFKALFVKRDPLLLGALRKEMQAILKRAHELSQHCDETAANRLEIFIDTLLSNFPFMDPAEGEKVEVPQRINGVWQLVEYKFKKIDLSPKAGWRSWLLGEDDHIYAYGLEPLPGQAEGISPHLLLMGTTYLSGQGSTLSLLGDLTPGKSVGEAHDLANDLQEWIDRNENIKITGHSQGGTMAQIVAAKYPGKVLRASCLNPAALLQTTVDELLPLWNKRRERQPEICVYTQTGEVINDPIFIFGENFLPGTKVFNLSLAPPCEPKTSALAAHAQHYSGHKSASYRQLSEDELAQALRSNKRKFFNDLKSVADLVISPVLNLSLIYSACKRKISNFCSKHEFALRAVTFFLALVFYAWLIVMTGGAAITLAPLLAKGSLLIGALVGAALTSYLLPKLSRLAANLTQAAVGLAAACVIGITLGLSAIVAGLCALKRAY